MNFGNHRGLGTAASAWLAIIRQVTSQDVTEVPFYLASRFGVARVKQAVGQVETDVTSEPDKQKLKTVLYWLGAYGEIYPDINS